MRLALQIIGVALFLAGGLWTLQGLGIVMWPADSFMLADSQWAIYGVVTCAIGIALFVWGSRRRPR